MASLTEVECFVEQVVDEAICDLHDLGISGLLFSSIFRSSLVGLADCFVLLYKLGEYLGVGGLVFEIFILEVRLILGQRYVGAGVVLVGESLGFAEVLIGLIALLEILTSFLMGLGNLMACGFA